MTLSPVSVLAVPAAAWCGGKTGPIHELAGRKRGRKIGTERAAPPPCDRTGPIGKAAGAWRPAQATGPALTRATSGGRGNLRLRPVCCHMPVAFEPMGDF